MLSNASPPSSGNMLGYSDAVLILWLLQAPIALGPDSSIDITIMARCCLQGHNPVPGYLLTQLPHPSNGEPSRPGAGQKPDWILKTDGVSPVPGDKMTNWVVWHDGDAWLGGGHYFAFYQAHKPAPTASGNQVGCYGSPRVGSVYTSSDVFPEWETNYRRKAVPKYFAVFLSPISQVVFLVGFTNFEWAKNQAAGYTGLVPANVELSITYDRDTPKWSQFAGDTDKIQTYFYEVYRAEYGRSYPVYTTENPIQGTDYPADTRTGGHDVPDWGSMTPYLPVPLHPALAQPSPPASHQPPTSIRWLSETQSRSRSYNALLTPRYPTSRRNSLPSTDSSDWWSQGGEGPSQQAQVTPPPPTAPNMTLDELMGQLTLLAQQVPPELAATLTTQLQPPARPFDYDTTTDPGGPLQFSSDSEPEAGPSDASPPPVTPSGLPDWAKLWLRTLQIAGQVPPGGTPFVP